MEKPKMSHTDRLAYDEVSLLLKTIYGLKQSGRVWNECLDAFIVSVKFIRSIAEPCVYFHHELEIIIGIYVDDLFVFVRLKLDDMQTAHFHLTNGHILKKNSSCTGCVIQEVYLSHLIRGKS